MLSARELPQRTIGCCEQKWFDRRSASVPVLFARVGG